MQNIHSVCPEIFLTAANRACLHLEQEQHCTTWEIWGGWTALPQNGSCDVLKHALNTAFSIHRSPTSLSWQVSRQLSFGFW